MKPVHNGALFSFVFLILLASGKLLADVNFCAVGDILLDRRILTQGKETGLDFFFDDVLSLIKRNDLAFCNLECSVSDSGAPLNKTYIFHAKPESLINLEKTGFNIISIANNHTIDWGRDAFIETKCSIERYNMFPVGGGNNQQEARQAVIIERNGLKFAFLGYIDMLLEGLTFLEDKPAPAWATIDEIINEIKNVRDKVDFVIVSFHWGVEFQPYPTINQTQIAHKLIDKGADLIIGHHPHVLSRIEQYKGKYIIYSLGNFLFDQRKLTQTQSMIFGCSFDKNGMHSPYFIPIILKNYKPYIAKGVEAKEIIGVIEKLSEGYNVKLCIEKNKILIKSEITRDLSDTPLFTFESNSKKILAFGNKLKLFGKDEQMIDSLAMNKGEEIKACCAIEESDYIYLYGIIGKINTVKGEYVAVFPIRDEKFCRPLKDPHKFNPWKIMLSDVDGDNKADLCLGVWKKTRFFKENENRLFIYNRQGNYIYPKWLGSKFENPFVDFSFADIDHDGINELILLEQLENTVKNLVVYKWHGFGFEYMKILKTNYSGSTISNPEALLME
jgi:poly-gamma-glutamate synthesis protein (capsule biosynthesis protein)